MRKLASALTVAASLIHAGTASGQAINAEAALTAGYSSEEKTSAAATQLRVFGNVKPDFHFYAEAAWASTTDDEVPAFSTAYPYGNRLQIIEAYAEQMLRPKHGLVGIKAGRYRTPFGISSSGDQGYSGFWRAPLIRYDDYFALSNNFLEHGVDVIVGVPRLTVETSLGVPADVGEAKRRSGLDTIVRVQGYLGNLVAGASYSRTLPYQSPFFAFGHARFTGIDARWMHSGVQVRGEWLTGRPFNGTTTTGWYADVIVHHVGMGPVTAVGRAENLAYEAPEPFEMYAKRQTIGARIRVLQQLAFQINLTHQTGGSAEYTSHPLDVGITYSIRRP